MVLVVLIVLNSLFYSYNSVFDDVSYDTWAHTIRDSIKNYRIIECVHLAYQTMVLCTVFSN